MGKRFFRGALAGLILLGILLSGVWFAPEALAASGIRRAVLIGNNSYQHMNDLGEAPQNDLMAVKAILASGRLTNGVGQIKAHRNLNRGQMLAAIANGFAGAKSSDISVFYFSGHGELIDGQAYLCPTNARGEKSDSMLSVYDLKAALDAVPGTKVVILDCCYSGGAIVKRSAPSATTASGAQVLQSALQAPFGGSSARFRSPSGAFIQNGYKVITASGSKELSYAKYWLESDASGSYGYEMSVFTKLLARSCGVEMQRESGRLAALPSGSFVADANRDGHITLPELYTSINKQMMQSDVSSSVQIYPQSDSFAMLSYDVSRYRWNNPVQKISAVASAVQGKPVRLNVQLLRPVESLELEVYHLTPSLVPLQKVAARSYGATGGGKIELEWNGQLGDGSLPVVGAKYFLSVSGTDKDGVPFNTATGMAGVSIEAKPVPPKFALRLGRDSLVADGQSELLIEVENTTQQRVAQQYDVQVLDANGKRVRILATGKAATESTEFVDGVFSCRYVNAFYWDGRDQAGKLCKPGQYKIRTTAQHVGQSVTQDVLVRLQSIEIARVTELSLSRAALNTLSGNNTVRISGRTSKAGTLVLELADSGGNVVCTLHSKAQQAGVFSYVWRGQGASGATVKSGTYAVRAYLKQTQGSAPAMEKTIQVKAGKAPKTVYGVTAQQTMISGGRLKFSFKARSNIRVIPTILDEQGQEVGRLSAVRAKKGRRVTSYWQGYIGAGDERAYLKPGRYKLVLNAYNAKTGAYSPSVEKWFEIKSAAAPRLTNLRTSGKFARHDKYTYLRFTVNVPGRLYISVYDRHGRRVNTPMAGRYIGAGKKNIRVYLGKHKYRMAGPYYTIVVDFKGAGGCTQQQSVKVRIR